MYQNINEQFGSATRQFADTVAEVNRLSLASAEKAFGLQLSTIEENTNAAFAFWGELAGVRDIDGLKAVLPKGVQVARESVERSVSTGQEVFGQSVKTGEALVGLVRPGGVLLYSVCTWTPEETVGVVAQLLVDPGAMKVRYLDIDVHEDLFRLKDDRHVVLPLEQVDLRERGKDVWVERLPAASIALLPAYTGGAVSAPLERAIGDAFSGATRPQLNAGARAAPSDDGFVREEFGPVNDEPAALEGPAPEPYPLDEPPRDR